MYKDDNNNSIHIGDLVRDYWNGLDAVDSRGDTYTDIIIKDKFDIECLFESQDSKGRICKILNEEIGE